jgi:tetratricopeptide (TPR) repeat protein
MSESNELTALIDAIKRHIRSNAGGSALATADRAVEQFPEAPEAHEIRASVLFLMERYDEAIAGFEAALELAPRRAATLVNLGAVYNRKQEYAKAVEVLRKAVLADKRSAEGFYNLGYAHRHLGQPAMAIPAYREAIRLSPRMADAHQNLGNVYLEMRNYPQAVASFTKALEIAPDHQRAIRGLQKANEAIAGVRETVSPFGRLVDVEALEQGQQTAGQRYRVLAAADRFYDRQFLHQANQEVEREVRTIAVLLETELLPALKKLNRSMAEGARAGTLITQRKELDAARAKLAMSGRKLEAATGRIATHERSMCE